MNVSARLNELFVENPDRNDEYFWSLLKGYIETVANRLVPQTLIADLTQDSLFQVLVSLDKFVHQPSHAGTGFSRWVCAVVFRRAGNLKRATYGARETPESQIGTFQDGDHWLPADLSALKPQLSDSEFEDALSTESWPARAESALKSIRSAIPARDVDLFNAIRTSGEIKSSTLAVGLKAPTGYSRMRSWRNLVESPGARPSSKQGVPCSKQPDERLALACIAGNPAAIVIRDSWRHASIPVVLMSATEFDSLADKGFTTHSA